MIRGLCAALGIGAATAALIALTVLPASARVVNQVVAVVGKEVITLRELDERISEHLDDLARRYSGQELKKRVAELRSKALNLMINDRLAEAEARAMGISVSDADVDKAVESILETNRMTRQQLERTLATEGLTWESYRDKLRKQILQSRLVYRALKPKIFIPKEDKLALYNARKDQYKGDEQVVLRRIVLSLDQRELAETLKQRLDGGADFARLAREFSIGPEAESGGLLGSFSVDQVSARIREAIKGLEPGQHTAVVESPGGFQIFQLVERKITPGKTFEEVEPQLTEELTNKALAKKFEKWIAEVRKKSFVKIIPIKD